MEAGAAAAVAAAVVAAVAVAVVAAVKMLRASTNTTLHQKLKRQWMEKSMSIHGSQTIMVLLLQLAEMLALEAFEKTLALPL